MWTFGSVSGWWWTPVIPVGPVPAGPFTAVFPPDSGLVGGVQLDVQPWRAQVYVDGQYAGLVEAFAGYYRHLELPAGPHLIAIVADNYEPLVLDVLVPPGQTITHRGALTYASGR